MQKYCRCGSTKELDPSLQKFYPLDKKYVLFWVCENCNRPSHVVQETSVTYAPRGALGVRDVFIGSDGTSVVTWRMPDREQIKTLNFFPYPRRLDMVDQGRDHLLKIWHMLDAVIDEIKDPGQGHNMEYNKARGGALSDVIFQFMGQFYEDRNAVTREALNRYNARQAGTDHETPGLAETEWDPTIRFQASAEMKAPVASGNRVPDKAVDTARSGIQMGMFTVAQMAETYKMTEDELKKQLNL